LQFYLKCKSPVVKIITIDGVLMNCIIGVATWCSRVIIKLGAIGK